MCIRDRLCLILAGCGTVDTGGRLISAAEGAEAYSAALAPFLPGYSLQTAEDTLYAEVSRGSAVACFDVQALSLIHILYLRDRSDAEGKCWPGIKTIASDCSYGKKSIFVSHSFVSAGDLPLYRAPLPFYPHLFQIRL